MNVMNMTFTFEGVQNLVLIAFILGLFSQWFLSSIIDFCSFFYKLSRKYMRLRRLKKRKMNNNL